MIALDAAETGMLAAILLLLVVLTFLSIAEMGLSRVSRHRATTMAETGTKSGHAVLWLTSEPERWRFSFKVAPERFLELTDQPGIKPARWLGKHRWVTVVDVSSVPGAYLKDLVAWSYRHALAKLSRRQREAIAGATADPGDTVR